MNAPTAPNKADFRIFHLRSWLMKRRDGSLWYRFSVGGIIRAGILSGSLRLRKRGTVAAGGEIALSPLGHHRLRWCLQPVGAEDRAVGLKLRAPVSRPGILFAGAGVRA